MKITALISPDFLERNNNLPEEVIFESPKINGGKKYLSIIRRGDSEENHYFFSQRMGKNSIRFIIYDKTRSKPFGLLEHFEASHNRIVESAYSGSLDKDLSPLETCRQEVNEESLYHISKEEIDRITLVRPMNLGSQTNEIAYLYLVDVSGLPETPMVPQNEWEENVNHNWMDLEEVKAKGDWCSYVIADSTVKRSLSGLLGTVTAFTIEEKLERLKARRSPYTDDFKHNQRKDYDCGVATVYSIMDYFNVDNESYAVTQADLKTSKVTGTEPNAMRDLLVAKGLKVLRGLGETGYILLNSETFYKEAVEDNQNGHWVMYIKENENIYRLFDVWDGKEYLLDYNEINIITKNVMVKDLTYNNYFAKVSL